MSADTYRPDIDGLRAIAVLSVVAFHVSPRLLPGGFVGVDVFFVLSGYLISGVILDRLREQRFSFADFYARRTRRLFPALALVLLAVWACGWFALFCDEYMALGKQVAAGALFVANIVLWQDAGYFDRPSALKPLLHLWSLGVEEQFYLVWPVTLVAAWRLRWNLGVVVGILAIASFAANVALVASHRDLAFYLLPSRLWELLLGAGLVVAEQRQALTRLPAALRNHLATAGLIGVLASLWLVPQDQFPGWWALLPTVGTGLVIQSGAAGWVNRHILSRSIPVRVGLISYPLYLWHWPLLTFTRIAESGAPSMALQVGAVLLAFPLSLATYRLVELPIRRGGPWSKRPFVVAGLVGALALAATLGAHTYLEEGYKRRPRADPDVGKASLSQGKAGQGHYDFTTCPLPGEQRGLAEWCVSDSRSHPRLVVIGDSHAQAIYPGLVGESAADDAWALIGKTSCPPLAGVPIVGNDACTQLNQATLVALTADQSVKVVLIAVAYRILDKVQDDLVAESLGRTVRLLEESGKRVAILVDNPEITENPEACVGERPLRLSSKATAVCSIPRLQHEARLKKFRAVLAKVQERRPSLLVYDPTDLLCTSETCSVMRDGRSLYSFTDHYSDVGSKLVAGDLLAWLRPKL